MLNGMRSLLSAGIEVHPPHGKAAREAHEERKKIHRMPLSVVSKSNARGQHRFAQRHYDEQLAALRKVAAVDGPICSQRAPQAREPQPDHRRNVLAQHAATPEQEARLSLCKAATDPECRTHKIPSQDALEIGCERMTAPYRQKHTDRAPDLNAREANRKD